MAEAHPCQVGIQFGTVLLSSVKGREGNRDIFGAVTLDLGVKMLPTVARGEAGRGEEGACFISLLWQGEATFSPVNGGPWSVNDVLPDLSLP